jgi:hypothetical protein
VAEENGGCARQVIGRVAGAGSSWVRSGGAWAEAACRGHEKTLYISTLTFDRTRATTTVSLYGTGNIRIAPIHCNATPNQSLVASDIKTASFERKSSNIDESGLTSIESHLAFHQSEARSEQSNVASSRSLARTNQSEAAFDHSPMTTNGSRRASNQRRTTSMRTALRFDISLRALNRSEARFAQRALRSDRDDVHIASRGVASVCCELAPLDRHLGIVRRDVTSNGRDLMANEGDVLTS